jgi:hypothetical protein
MRSSPVLAGKPCMRPARYCMGLSRAFTSLRFPHWPGRGGESISRDVAQKLGFGYLNKAIVVSHHGVSERHAGTGGWRPPELRAISLCWALPLPARTAGTQ